MCKAVLDEKFAAKLNAVSLSDSTIEYMSEDIKFQLIDRLKTGFFALQLDESTDITNESQFMVYVRYCWESEMIEDFLLCHAMLTRTTGEEVFKVLDSSFSIRLIIKPVHWHMYRWSGVNDCYSFGYCGAC